MTRILILLPFADEKVLLHLTDNKSNSQRRPIGTELGEWTKLLAHFGLLLFFSEYRETGEQVNLSE